jgi:type I restriction enzyme M protein
MSTNINAKANLIWEVATKLVGVYKPHEYGKVILPMTVLKRFDDILKPTKEKVLEKYEEVKNFEVKEPFLTEASGYIFYNTSKYDFEKLLADPDNIESNFKNYLNGFSDNVIDILNNFKFENEVKTMSENRLLYVVLEELNSKKAYMGLDEVKTEDMGYIFEELVRKFSESYDEEAGAHFTARDIIYLMTDLLVAEERDVLINENKVKTIYDMAMGTSQMLSCMTDRLKQLNENVNVACYGQELNPETYAIAKADMLIKGGDADNFKQGDTLKDMNLIILFQIPHLESIGRNKRKL